MKYDAKFNYRIFLKQTQKNTTRNKTNTARYTRAIGCHRTWSDHIAHRTYVLTCPARDATSTRRHSRANERASRTCCRLAMRPSPSRPPPPPAAFDPRGGGPFHIVLRPRLGVGGGDAGRQRRRRGGGELGCVGAAGAADRTDRGGRGARDDPIVVEGVATGASDPAEVASDEEVGAVDAGVAGPAQGRRVRLAVDGGAPAAEFAWGSRLHPYGRKRHRSSKGRRLGCDVREEEEECAAQLEEDEIRAMLY
ncbi:hypothetical protein B296_00040267 [Ensete ventricosum]|uniref:Uncharacterized protein n=1 Tax=Ensete ventricosum TaxID=4639 RepID=A0A426YSI0_ENSVE|nr:hypothetical protein B296_00040267 [Ensete ventricosum]